MSADPLILVVGGDALAVRVCEELCATQGHRVVLVWMHDHELAAKMDRIGCDYHPHAPNDLDVLRVAGVMEAVSIMTVSDDDRLNLQVALKARDLNPAIRVVLRQFNRTLGRKLEQNLPNCSVISVASHSAPTFVGSALDPSCFYALQFPDLDGPYTGFSEREVSTLEIVGLTPEQAQEKLRLRIVARNGSPDVLPHRPFAPGDTVVIFAKLERLEATSGTRGLFRTERRRERLERFRIGVVRRLGELRRIDPILARVLWFTGAVFALAVAYFSTVMQRDPFTMAYFVITTATTTGYGDIVPSPYGPMAELVALFVMITGVAASGIFIAYVTSSLTRAQFTAMQGLRQIRTRGHVLVCGSGNVGTRAIDALRSLHEKIVVVDTNPDPALVESSRAHRIEVLTGDATKDRTLDLCNVAHARAVVALTDSDTSNLEVALGARARNPQIPVVMRVQDEAFAQSVAQQFEAILSYSTIALVAATFAMVSRFPGTRGRIAFGNDTYNVGERQQGEVPQPPPAEDCIPLAVMRNGTFLHIDRFEEMAPYDRLLFLVPLSQFQPAPPAGRATAASAFP
jgi:Trk K+ transport system NAD-binding subunit